MTPTAIVDPRACAAHGDCVDVAPHVFELGDDEVALVHGTAPLDVLVKAAEACPSVAISIVDSDTGEQLYP